MRICLRTRRCAGTLAQPVPWLPGQNGLFTGNNLGTGRHVTGHTGKKSTCRLNGSCVLEVSPGMLVDAKGRGLQQCTNHSCDPNCVFQKQSDSPRGVRRANKTDEELTVNCSSARENFACKCLSCEGFTKATLLLGVTGLSEHHLQQRLSIQQSLNLSNVCKATLRMGSKVGPRTVSLEPMDRDELSDHGEGANSHFACDWNRTTLVKCLEAMRIIVDTVQPDNCWMPDLCNFKKAKPAFCQQTLPDLGKFIRVGGGILLPAQVCMPDGLLSNRESWEPNNLPLDLVPTCSSLRLHNPPCPPPC